MDETDEQLIRSRTAAIPLEWVERVRGRVDGEDRAQFVDLIAAAQVVDDEARLALQRWIDAGRRAGLSWAEIGAILGISKQAAQQRFGGGAGEERLAGDAEIEVGGATALNEMRLLRQEGEKGRELVAVGALRLFFRQTGQKWEYRRLTALAPDARMARLRAQGWSHAASWFPFEYFKRPTNRPAAGAERDSSRKEMR